MNKIKRREFLRALGAGAASFALLGCAESVIHAAINSSERRKPNILLIYADDLGWNDLGCFGNTYHETPNIDQLCKEGIMFTDAYACGPVCAPSRACLMSGQYVPRHGIYLVGKPDNSHPEAQKLLPPENVKELPLEITTLADEMRAAGYTTGYCGKWHLGHKGEKISEYHPSKRGFDWANQTRSPKGETRYFSPDFWTIPKAPIKEGTYLTDYITQQALGFIERSKDKPFFLYLPHFAVHGPLEAKEKTIEKYRKKEKTEKHDNPIYAAMHEHLDDNVGLLLKKLDDLKLSDNTIVIFYSDNGGHEKFSNAPLRAGKGWLYEGGIRVPLIVRWPGKVKPGTVCKEPVIGVDFLPTLLDIAGSKGVGKQVRDGESFLPLLLDSKGKLNRDAIFWHYPTYMKWNKKKKKYMVTPCSAIRMGDYKLLHFYEDDHVELYNLKKDIGEKNNLATKMPEKAKFMDDKLAKWVKDTKAMMPTKRKKIPQKNEKTNIKRKQM